MRPARLAIPVVAALLVPAALSSQSAPSVGRDPAAQAVEAAVEPAIDALWNGYDADQALSHVRFISQYWRLAGNTGFNASIDHVRERLEAAGVRTAVDEYPSASRAWEFSVGTLAIVTDGGTDEVVLSRDKDRLPVCINSFSTPRGGVVAPLIDVGRGDRDADYEGKDVKGAVVVGDADPAQLWRRGVAARGAIGVVSGALPDYLNADPPGAAVTPRDEWDILQWSSVPYDEARKGFGFKASPRAMATLRGRMAAGPVSVRVTVASTFTEAPTRTLIAEIPGRSAPAERIVLAAHVQEPGANDNASGVATLAETAVAMAAAVKSGRLPAPERTLTFLFLSEISGSRRWLQDHADQAKGVRYMFSFDMTGEDVAKTGGTFLVERYPDPGAVWERPWDPHSEWGRGNVRADSLRGDLINDAHLFVVRQVAKRTGWVVTTNPYEGGSDHTVFGQAGVPSVLDWHFTDRYYHTNFDTPDKTSPAEMKNVGVAAGATAWLLASATPAIAADIAGVVAAAGRDRVAIETTEGAKLVAAGTSTAQQEATIVSAWRKWYAEAVRSASRLVVGEPPASFGATIDRLASAFEGGGGGFGMSALWVGLGSPMTSQVQPAGSGAVFICGKDQIVPAPILPSWVALVMAGDGRLYRPCEDGKGPHAFDHREVREQKLIREGVVSADDEVRWRATQAAWRNPHFPYLPALVSDRPPRGVDADQILGTPVRVTVGFLVLGDTLGGLAPFLTVYPACDAVAQVIDVVTAEGRVAARWHPGLLFHRMRDRNWNVRREAAFGIGMRLADPDLDPKVRQAALTELKACLAFERQPEVRGQILEAFGSARYEDDGQRGEAEDVLVEKTVAPAPVVLGGVRALEMLLRQNPRRPVKDATLTLLRRYVSYGVRAVPGQNADLDARIRRVAMIALQTVRDADQATVLQAGGDADWQVRRLVASRLNLNDPALLGLADALARDPAFQVRYDFLSTLARQAGQTHVCAPVAAYINDPSPHVAMKAIDSLAASCTDLEEPVAELVELASRLANPTFNATWHLPLRALTVLARLQPEEARRRLKPAVEHAAWQVRAAAAGLCATFGAVSDLQILVRDREPNVRTAALNALAGLNVREVVDPAIEVLTSASDHQLLRAAAIDLKGTPAESRERVTNALLNALKRLTDRAQDTSRDPRVAILDRLAETMAPERSSDLLAYVVDFDDAVGTAAAKAFEAIVGTPPAPQPLQRRYPFQPTESELSDLPKQAVIDLEEGQVTLDLLIDVAPVTVARFARIVNQRFYNGQTFHRVVPNFVVQGGSPGANEYAGATPRYMRDEVGPQAAHIRGAVGISSRGPDTGDGQIFIDLVDLPRLDRDYTVFAYVTEGMEFVDRLLEGARIVSVSLKK